MTCSGQLPTRQRPAAARAPLPAPSPYAQCPLPRWLEFTDEFFFKPDMLECAGITFQ